MKKIIFLVIISLSITSCTFIFSKLYGVKEISGFNQREYRKFINSVKDSTITMYDIAIDSSDFTRFFKYETSPHKRKIFSQPIQILYFNKSKKLISFHANCFAKGKLTNLDWNTDLRFNTFPPLSAVAADSIPTNLNKYRSILETINFTDNKKYVIIIFWTRMLEKVSKTAILTVINNLKKFNKVNDSVIILVNTDDFFKS